MIKSDIIKSEEQIRLLNEWINNKNNKYTLIYKGTRDGDSFDNFHNKCDNQGPTLMIIETTDEQIFGGYTEKSWIKIGNISSPESFLFNLNIKKKYYINGKGFIHSSNYYGGKIGFGDSDFFELCFFNNYLNNQESVIYGLSSYRFKSFEISGGKNIFTIKEMEVYKIN